MSKGAAKELQKLDEKIASLREEIQRQREGHNFYPNLERHKETLEKLEKQLSEEQDTNKKHELGDKIKKTESFIKQTQAGIDDDPKIEKLNKELAKLKRDSKEKLLTNAALADLQKEVKSLVIDADVKQNLVNALTGQSKFEKTGLKLSQEELKTYAIPDKAKEEVAKVFGGTVKKFKKKPEQQNPQQEIATNQPGAQNSGEQSLREAPDDTQRAVTLENQQKLQDQYKKSFNELQQKNKNIKKYFEKTIQEIDTAQEESQQKTKLLDFLKQKVKDIDQAPKLDQTLDANDLAANQQILDHTQQTVNQLENNYQSNIELTKKLVSKTIKQQTVHSNSDDFNKELSNPNKETNMTKKDDEKEQRLEEPINNQKQDILRQIIELQAIYTEALPDADKVQIDSLKNLNTDGWAKQDKKEYARLNKELLNIDAKTEGLSALPEQIMTKKEKGQEQSVEDPINKFGDPNLKREDVKRDQRIERQDEGQEQSVEDLLKELRDANLKRENVAQEQRIEELEARLKGLKEVEGEGITGRLDVLEKAKQQISELAHKKLEIADEVEILEELNAGGWQAKDEERHKQLNKELSNIDAKIDAISALPDQLQELFEKERAQEVTINEELKKQLELEKRLYELTILEDRTPEQNEELKRLPEDIETIEEKISKLTSEQEVITYQFQALQQEALGTHAIETNPETIAALEEQLRQAEIDEIAAERIGQAKAELQEKIIQLEDNQKLLLDDKREKDDLLSQLYIDQAAIEEKLEEAQKVLLADEPPTEQQLDEIDKLQAKLKDCKQGINNIEQELKDIENDINFILNEQTKLQSEINTLEVGENKQQARETLEARELEINKELDKLASIEVNELTDEELLSIEQLEAELEDIKAQKEEILGQEALEESLGRHAAHADSLDLPFVMEAGDSFRLDNTDVTTAVNTSSITEDIRNEVINEQIKLLKEWVETNYPDYDQNRPISEYSNQEFSKFLQENRELTSIALSDPEFKAELEQAEIVGYKTVYSKHHDDMSPVTWEPTDDKEIRSKPVIKDGVELCTLTEVTSHESLTIANSAGEEVEIKSHRIIEFDTHLYEGASGPLDISMAVKDKDGKNIAEKDAVYFTAHYDNSGKLVEVSTPQPIKFLGSGNDAIGYIEHKGEIYTLPVTKGNYTDMIKEVQKNKGFGLDLSESVEKPVERAKDTFMGLSHETSKELRNIKETIGKAGRETGGETKALPPPLQQDKPLTR